VDLHAKTSIPVKHYSFTLAETEMCCDGAGCGECGESVDDIEL
jgi:hypothetical protein